MYTFYGQTKLSGTTKYILYDDKVLFANAFLVRIFKVLIIFLIQK